MTYSIYPLGYLWPGLIYARNLNYKSAYSYGIYISHIFDEGLYIRNACIESFYNRIIYIGIIDAIKYLKIHL